jgi:HD-GYP domain-containing protein (c-di-GMP phosphodiesterase class II)
VDIRLSELVSALSHALDVTGGQPMGHAERTCLIGQRLADVVGLESAQRSSLFYALLLKDAGCSTTAAAVATTFGSDDQQVKRDSRLIDLHRPRTTLGYLRRNVASGAPLLQRAHHLRAVVAMSRGGVDELERMRCERGADIARAIGLDEDAATAITQLFEHWDGNGHPGERAGEEISLLARMACLSQTMEVFWQNGGAAAACDVARARRGTWFDPALVDAVDELERDVCFWASLETPDVQAVEPADRVLRADDAGLDRVAEAFAGIVDAKSPFTARHCEGVAEIADGIAATMGLDDATRRLLRRAALLHDLGKLGVSNRILDKPGKLDPAEWAAIRRHPELTERILERVPPFRHFAGDAGAHHERLDGRGYFRGLAGEQLAWMPRILAVADVFEALTADRPYRSGLAPDEALEVMRRDPGAFCPDCFAALEAWVLGAAPRSVIAPA